MAEHLKAPFVLDSNSKESRMNEYQPLKDHHLSLYFSSPSVRKTLKKNGVINEQGVVVQKVSRSTGAKIVLPPIRYVPVYRTSLSGTQTFASTKYSTASTGRIKTLRTTEETDIAANTMKTEPTTRPKPPRAAGKSTWGYKTLRPLNHEEYESLLQKYYAVAEAPAAETVNA